MQSSGRDQLSVLSVLLLLQVTKNHCGHVHICLQTCLLLSVLRHVLQSIGKQTSFVLFECLAGFAGHWRPCAGLCVSDFRWCVPIQCGKGLHSAQAHQTESAQGKDDNAFSCQCDVAWYKSSLLLPTFCC